jgi:hypothetical protein
MTDPVATLREGLRDRYAFERELGRGGMATVWLARGLRHDRPVASVPAAGGGHVVTADARAAGGPVPDDAQRD